MASETTDPKSSHRTLNPFRLMKLPRELRDLIYAAILCPSLPRNEAFGTFLRGSLRPPGSTCIIPLGHAAVSYKIETQILRVSKMVYKEAKDVMLGTNRFVRVTTRGILLFRIALERQLLIWTGRGNELPFNGYVMHHVIQDMSINVAPQLPAYDFILLACDLDIFLRGLTRSHFVESPSFPDLFEADQVLKLVSFPEGDSPSLRLHESLLRPYRTCLRGFPRFTIEGCATIGQEVTEEVTKNVWEDEQHILAELQYMKQLADAYLRADSWCHDSSAWAALEIELSWIHRREVWLESLEAYKDHAWPMYTPETGHLEQAIQLSHRLASLLAVSQLSALREHDLEAIGTGLASHTDILKTDERTRCREVENLEEVFGA
ncbi:hypothetical protein BU16DRAFT_145329 [Lophium mytilinum]|uniref:F-box domain-containing protein n=1 Tax=Lophium mytilinum TaxID=390894 RepID=A0A6A6QGG9_9PEZI|nr:hypothetical protein BU16DRAFT_145329 [Lophium mytilinum]